MTIFDQLNRLPIPYRDLALKNANKARLNDKCDLVSDALIKSFFWLHTPEEDHFWYEVYEWTRYHTDGIQTGTEAPKLPPIPEDKP